MNKRKIFLIAGIAGSIALALCLALVLILRGVINADRGQGATQGTTLPPPTENVFTPTDFGYEEDYLTCLTQESVRGIDVSKYQGQIDWQQVKDSGVEFVMIRTAYRGYGQSGVLKEDEYARTNYENAKAAGLKVGVYLFSQAVSVEEAREEALFLLEIIKDWQLEMPVAYDWECLADDYRTVGVDSRTLTDCAKAFCDEVEAAGFDSMIYFNPNQSRTMMYLAELVDYGFWLAMYTDQMTYEYKVDMWQYTKEGAVAGVSGNVDINLWFPYEKTE